MTLRDDDVVGMAAIWRDETGEAILFRDLDKHIQDRLRAAEELAEAAREYAGAECYGGDGHESIEQALAAYEATFTQEADT